MWAQIVIMLIVLVGLIINIINEGKPKDVNFDTMNYVIKYGFILFLLYKGGFFNRFFI